MQYTVGRLAGVSRAPAEFVARGITGDRRMASQVEIYGHAEADQFFYAQFKSMLPAYMHATIAKRAVTCNAEGYSFELEDDCRIPFPQPMVYAMINSKTFDETEIENLKITYGMLIESDQGNVLKVVFKRPSKDLINLLLERCSEMNVKMNRLNDLQCTSVSGYMAFCGIVDIISAFLMTNAYPCFKTHPIDYLHENTREIAYITTAGQLGKGGRALPPSTEKWENYSVEVGDGHDTGGITTEENHYILGCLMDVIAKPSPYRPRFNCGPTNEVPNMPGIAFGYFDELLDGDFTFPFQVIIRHFTRSLGATADEIRENIPQIAQGCRQFATTYAGRAISHVLIGVELCLQTQSMLYVIIEDNVYLGFVLLGGGYSVSICDKWVYPESAVELQDTVLKMSTHKALLRQIAEELSRWQVNVGGTRNPPTDVTSDMIDKPRKLVKVVQSRFPPGEQSLQQLSNIANKLMYSQSYWAISTSNIIQSLKLIIQGGVIEDEDPLFPFKDFVMTAQEDYRIKSVLALFGARPWSLLSGGNTFHIKAPLVEDTNIIRAANGMYPLDVICILPKLFDTAVRDCKKMIADKVFTVKVGRMSAAIGVKLKGEDARKFYISLKETIFAPTTELTLPGSSTGLKRKADSAPIGGMFGFKKRKVIAKKGAHEEGADTEMQGADDS